MKIGIDIDEVIANQLDELVKFYHKEKGVLIEKEKFHTYYWPEVWGISLEEAVEIDKKFKESKYFEKILPVEDAVESIKQLIRNNELFLITARPILFKEKTEKWVEKHLKELPIRIIHSGDFHLNNKSAKKSDICNELGVNLMIEDQKNYSLDCAEKGIKVILFDKPWNKNFQHNNIIRVFGWKEAVQIIEKLNLEGKNGELYSRN